MEKFANQECFHLFSKYFNNIEILFILICLIYIIFHIYKSNTAVRDADKNVFEIQIHVLMSSIIIVATTLLTLLDCILCKFESTENIKSNVVSRRKNSSLIFCVFLYLSLAIPLFWKRFEVDLIEIKKIQKIHLNY